ncbi:MAG: hypothetical protein ACOVS5_07970 [Oligoflexus sp.]
MTVAHVDYRHTPTLEDVVATQAHRQFKAFLLQREAETLSALAALARKRRWNFMARNYAFKATVLQRHAEYLSRL